MKSRFLRWLYSPAGEAVYLSVTGLVAVSLFFWMGFSARSQRTVFVISIITYSMVLFLATSYAAKPSRFFVELKAEMKKRGEPDFFLVGLPGVLFGSFVVLSHSMSIIWPNRFFHVPPDATLTTWLAYGLDNIIRAALLDFGEIYFIDVSGIDHTRNFLACTLVFSFRTILSFTLIAVFFRAWRQSLSSRSAYDS
ncbi:MAG: hypothetical protein HZA88_01785 [Verrucomicrobia bacterium]|nr:hypothetical protein [Verrucomicrobiota bacterium]